MNISASSATTLGSMSAGSRYPVAAATVLVTAGGNPPAMALEPSLDAVPLPAWIVTAIGRFCGFSVTPNKDASRA
jgi:hypothetical protein